MVWWVEVAAERVACEGLRMHTRRRPSPAQQRAAGKARRLGAAELFARVACRPRSPASSVSRQSADARLACPLAADGIGALPSCAPTGPDPKLSAAQLASIEQALLLSAKAARFDTDLWTLERSGW
jgi:hypothetical protein